MTNSEKLLSSFSENYFYKELVYADLKFTPIGGTEIELADLIINLEDIILAIQLKERNEKDRTQDKNIEEKWLKKKCKKAKEQIKDTISYITMTLFVYIKLFESIVTVEGEDFLNSREEKECYKLVRESTKFIYDRLEEFSKYNCKTASDELNRHMRNMFKNMRSSLKEEVGSIKKDFL